MSGTDLPDFEHTLAIAKGELDAASLAECHGVVCGLLCRMPDASFDVLIGLLDMLELVTDPGTGLRLSLEELLVSTRLQLSDEELGYLLWLPGEDETLEDRTMALAHWCSGFLAALGSGGEATLQVLSEDAEEALRDLQQIARADVTDTRQSEEDESAYVEIVEYIRIATMMIMEDLRGPGGEDAIH